MVAKQLLEFNSVEIFMQLSALPPFPCLAAASCDANSMNTNPFTPSRWLLLSCLQKSIRRGRTDFALAAARHLHATEPRNLLRRLQIIGIEDIGCGDLPLVHRGLTTEGTDPATLLDLVTAMCGAVKDRSATDLCEAVNANIRDNALALEAARLMVAKTVSGSDALAREVARLGYQVTREPLCFAIPLVVGMAGGGMEWKPDTYTTLPLIHGLPSETFDMYTREGKASYRRALKHHPTLRRSLERWVAPDKVADLLGYAMFVVESGKLDRRLTYPGSADVLRLGQQADIGRWGVPAAGVDAVMAIVTEALPFIHRMRCEQVHYRESPILATNPESL